MTDSKALRYRIVPGLIILLTLSLPFLHFDISRKYNYQIAIVELVVIVIALFIYKKDMVFSLPIKSLGLKLIVAFLISALISTLLSPKPGLASERYFSIIIWLFYLWLVAYLIRREDLNTRTLLTTMALSCAAPIVVFIVANIASANNETLMETFKRLNLYSNIRHFGYHLTAATMFSFYFLINASSSIIRRSWGAALLLLNFTTLVITGGRQGILVSIIFSGLMLLLTYRQRWKRVLSYFVVFLLLIFLSVYLSDGEIILRSLIDRSVRDLSLGSHTNGRISIWLASIKTFSENWLIGYGADAFVVLRKSMGIKVFVHPHSIVVQSLLEWGVIGSIIYFSVLANTIKASTSKFDFHNLTLSPATTVAYFSVCAFLANALIDGIFLPCPTNIFLIDQFRHINRFQAAMPRLIL